MNMTARDFCLGVITACLLYAMVSVFFLPILLTLIGAEGSSNLLKLICFGAYLVYLVNLSQRFIRS